MSNVRWHSKGRHLWRVGGQDWIYIRKTRGDGMVSILLEEDHHHWFDGVWLFRETEKGGQIDLSSKEIRLEGPGPFEIEDLPEECEFLILMTVGAFARPPFKKDQDWLEMSCGTIYSKKGEKPLTFHIDGDSGGGTRLKFPMEPRSALNTFQDEPLKRIKPPSLVWVENIRSPFQLAQKLPSPVTVYAVPRGTKGGGDVRLNARLPAEKIRSVFEACATIEQGAFSPSSSLREFGNKALLPVVSVGEEYLVGDLLLPEDLFDENGVEIAVNNRVYAKLCWPVPEEWLTYEVRWGYYSDAGWAHELNPDVAACYPGHVTANFRRYNRDDGIPLFDRTDYIGWNLQLDITPVLFGEKLDKYTVTKYKSLGS